MDPGRRRMLGERVLLPTGGIEIAAGLEMRTPMPTRLLNAKESCGARSSAILNCSMAEFALSLVEVDPAIAAPRPCRAAIDGERLAYDGVRCLEVVQRGEGVASTASTVASVARACALRASSALRARSSTGVAVK